jgi:hypothetical protein
MLVAAAFGATWFYCAHGGSSSGWLDEILWSSATTLPGLALVRLLQDRRLGQRSAWCFSAGASLLLVLACWVLPLWSGWIMMGLAALYLMLNLFWHPTWQVGGFSLFAAFLPVILVVIASVGPIVLGDFVLNFFPGETIAGIALRLGTFLGFLMLCWDWDKS